MGWKEQWTQLSAERVRYSNKLSIVVNEAASLMLPRAPSQGRRPRFEPRASWWHQRRGQRRREGWARLMARGMMSGVTLPARGWFSL